MSKIKNGGLHQYGTEPFEQQQFGAAGVEEVNLVSSPSGVQDRAPAENILVLPACDRTPLAANFIHFQWNQIQSAVIDFARLRSQLNNIVGSREARAAASRSWRRQWENILTFVKKNTRAPFICPTQCIALDRYKIT